MSFPTIDEEPNGWRTNFHRLACYPGYVTRIRATEPIWANAVMESKGVQAKLEGAHVKRSVRTMMILTGRWLSE